MSLIICNSQVIQDELGGGGYRMIVHNTKVSPIRRVYKYSASVGDMMRALIHSLRLQQCSEGTASWSDPHGSSRSRGFLCFFVYWCGVCLTGLVEGGLSSLTMDKLALITLAVYCTSQCCPRKLVVLVLTVCCFIVSVWVDFGVCGFFSSLLLRTVVLEMYL